MVLSSTRFAQKNTFSNIKMPEVKLSEGVFTEAISGPTYDSFVKHQNFREGFVRFQPYNQVLPACYVAYEKRVKEFEVREDDVWISSFPKCGKTRVNLVGTPVVNCFFWR